jgi:hypothetical protein
VICIKVGMKFHNGSRTKFLSLSALMLAAALAAGWGALAVRAQSGDEPAAGENAETPVFVMPRSGPFSPETIAIPNAEAIAAWARSGHSDSSSEAFRHWDAEGEIPTACATCHSGVGFRDYHGLDGSTAGQVDSPAPIGGVVDCDTCHNPNLSRVTQVTLPSGVEHPVTGGEAACVTCHSGRSSGAAVGQATADKPADTPSGDLRFINPHYNIAAATNLGGYGGLGYQYPDKSYSGRFLHAKPVATCASCHDPHSLEIAQETCLTCHESGDPDDIRIARQSYDGSGDLNKGIKADIQANAERLMGMMMDYAAQVAGKPMVYDGGSYPYFFADANGDGLADQNEGRAVAYDAWTPRLVRATYNWNFVKADPGVHAHNPVYALELLYDSIEDLSGPLGVDMGTLGLLR